MKNSIKTAAGIIISCCALWGCKPPVPAAPVVDRVILPQDVLDSCTITSAIFDTWFASGKAAPNGLVLPANSVAFPHNNNCDFYQWAENMFLWVTSPNAGKYGGNGTVLESPVFYEVLPADSSGKRELEPHVAGAAFKMSSHITKNGPNRLPVILDNQGRLLEVEQAQPAPKTKALVKSASGSTVEVDHVNLDSKGAFVFLDKAGKVIDHPKAIIRHKLDQKDIVQQFTVGNKSVFLDSEGKQVQSEAGQATGDVLMTRTGSLVYYLTTVNDVYAYYATGVQEGVLASNQFPTTKGAMDSIVTYAKKHHAKLPDSTALAMEIKTSWVEASSVPNIGDYVTTMATVPTYDTTNSTKWIPTGHKTEKMALVGIHIVGSAAHHPEMIWATFEHQSNTPNAEYRYKDTHGNIKTVPRDTGKTWLFNSNATDTAVNHSHMKNYNAATKTSSDTITAVGNYTISPSNTLMDLPWGSAINTVTNPEDKSSAASNSEIISINNAVQKLLGGTDVRKNYLLVGATWTKGGAAPNSRVYTLKDTVAGVAIGTNVLANTTMETYFQSPKNSCFTCHSNRANPSVNPNDISHIFDVVLPLFKVHDVLNKKTK
jgi:hypothetical protein